MITSPITIEELVTEYNNTCDAGERMHIVRLDDYEWITNGNCVSKHPYYDLYVISNKHIQLDYSYVPPGASMIVKEILKRFNIRKLHTLGDVGMNYSNGKIRLPEHIVCSRAFVTNILNSDITNNATLYTCSHFECRANMLTKDILAAISRTVLCDTLTVVVNACTLSYNEALQIYTNWSSDLGIGDRIHEWLLFHFASRTLHIKLDTSRFTSEYINELNRGKTEIDLDLDI